jgi:hypothetical protein
MNGMSENWGFVREKWNVGRMGCRENRDVVGIAGCTHRTETHVFTTRKLLFGIG